MKPYDPSRKNHQTCAYGCCGYKGLKEHPKRAIFDRRARKASRRLGKMEIRLFLGL